MPPIGLAYIASSIRKAGNDVSVVDEPGSSPRNFSNLIKSVYVA